jgi:hypothetical protein
VLIENLQNLETMKKSIFNRMNVSALIGIMAALSIGVSANAQDPDRRLAEWSEAAGLTIRVAKEELKDELIVDEIVLDLPEELPSVTFINKEGEVVAVLHGDKSVLEDIYTDRFSRSYFLTSSGMHEVYLIKE